MMIWYNIYEQRMSMKEGEWPNKDNREECGISKRDLGSHGDWGHKGVKRIGKGYTFKKNTR